MEPERREVIRSYAEFELEVLHHAISVADQKASFVLGLAVAFAAAAFEPTVHALQAQAEPRAWLGVAGELGIIASAVAAFLTVAPRIVSPASTSATYWASPAFRSPPEAYIASIAETSPDGLDTAMLRHLHVSAGICRKKYARLRIAFYTAPAGVLLLALSYLAGPAY